MNRKIESWGDPTKHYTCKSQPEVVHANVLWEDAINCVAPQCHAAVARTVQLWNQKIRNQLTHEIGFQLRGTQISVRVVDGLPAPLSERLRHADDLAQMVMNRPLLSGVVTGTGFMESVWETVKSSRTTIGEVAKLSEIRRVRETAEAWLRLIEKHELSRILREINEDVLGAYFFYDTEVRIYWLPIGIFATLYGVPIEALTFVVLTHELAHAYTHLGSDIDGYKWPTREFAFTDIAIIEGLAQFYTEVVCSNLQAQMPEAVSAFETLLQHQSVIYETHRKWVQKDDRNSGEIVRVSLVECRRSGRTMHREDFLETVNRRRSEIMGRRWKHDIEENW